MEVEAMPNSPSTQLSSIRTLLEPTDIQILPQHRLQYPKTDLIPAICFYNGSFVPIHAGHLSVLEDAKQYINNLGTHECLGAYVSPSHSGYIAKKLKPDELVGAGHRLAMIYFAIENLDWVMVDLYEMFQPSRTALHVTMQTFISRVRTQLPHGADMDIFWLKGEDALLHTKSSDNLIQLGCQNLYVLNQECTEISAHSSQDVTSTQDYYKKRWQDIRAASPFSEKFHLVQATHMNLSSSTIRTCARSSSITRDQLQSHVQLASVTNYIIQHQLWSARLESLLTMIPTLPTFPHTIADFNSALLSTMLSTYSGLPIIVHSYVAEQIGVGKGWNGSVFRLHDIQYSPDSGNGLPTSMVLKLSTGIWLQRVASIEPEFYGKLRLHISNIEIPQCYYAARHPQSSNESLLVLEDLSSNYDPLPSKESLGESTAFFLIASIASLHAEFFQHPLLRQDRFAWLPTLTSTLTHYQTEYTRKMADPAHTQLLQSRLSSEAYTYAQALVSHIPHLFQTLTDEHYTLSHGDFWINNIFIRRGQPHRLVLFDWQTCCRANGVTDVAFFLRLLGSDQVRSLESRALDVYHQTLVKYGVSRYDLSAIRKDYYSMALPFMVIVLSSLGVIRDSKFTKIITMLEDIVAYRKTTE